MLDRQMENSVPEYYRTMYFDGYKPEEILFALRRHMKKAAIAENKIELPQVVVKSEVKIKK